MEAVFQDCIREAKQAGRTVLLSSHILAQVEALADRVSIIRSGRIVETGALGQLRHLSRTTITVGLERDVDRKSTRLNSSHVAISYAVFCLKKKREINKRR